MKHTEKENNNTKSTTVSCGTTMNSLTCKYLEAGKEEGRKTTINLEEIMVEDFLNVMNIINPET